MTNQRIKAIDYKRIKEENKEKPKAKGRQKRKHQSIKKEREDFKGLTKGLRKIRKDKQEDE